jgi:hypothetical protein
MTYISHLETRIEAKLDKIMEDVCEVHRQTEVMHIKQQMIEEAVKQISTHHDRLTKLEHSSTVQKSIWGWLGKNSLALGGVVMAIGAWAHSIWKTLPQ